MITRQDVEQLQLAAYLIRSYGYRIVTGVGSEHELWLLSKTHGTYPIIRIASDTVADSKMDQPRLEKEFVSLSKNITSQDPLLSIHINSDTNTTSDSGFEESVLNQGTVYGHNINDDFPGISHQLYPFQDAQAEYSRIQVDLSEYKENLPKQKKVTKFDSTNIPWVSFVVGGICLIIFACIHLFPFSENSAEVAIFYGAYYKPFILAGEWWRLLTPGFVHIDFWHIAMNLLSLASLGYSLERIIGHKKFAVILLGSIVFGSLTAFALQGNSVMVGLSGGLYGCMGAYFLYVILLGGWDNPMIKTGLIRVAAINLLMNFIPGIGWTAHLGGFVFGAVIMVLYLRKDYVKKNVKQLILVGGLVFSLVIGVQAVRNAKILPTQQYYGSDLSILRYEYSLGWHGYANWLASRLGDIYNIDIQVTTEESQ